MFDAALGTADIVGEALSGLLASPKTLPPKLFYDAEGVRLFGEITRLPEYYLTRTELGLLTHTAPAIAALAEPGAALIEYGASDETKARTLLDAPGARFGAYVPIDVAEPALAAMRRRLHRAKPELDVYPVHADFTRDIVLPGHISARPHFGFFPGSTIGNLDPDEAIAFLARARTTLGPDAWLVVGADLRKDSSRLLPAYDDAQGVTAAFNLNLLHRLNRDAAADFDPTAFAHRAIWNDAESRIEMHLVSLHNQTVHLAGQPIRFRRGETIHTENSYKHTPEMFGSLARSAGWTRRQFWTDPDQLFAIYALQA